MLKRCACVSCKRRRRLVTCATALFINMFILDRWFWEFTANRKRKPIMAHEKKKTAKLPFASCQTLGIPRLECFNLIISFDFLFSFVSRKLIENKYFRRAVVAQIKMAAAPFPSRYGCRWTKISDAWNGFGSSWCWRCRFLLLLFIPWNRLHFAAISTYETEVGK